MQRTAASPRLIAMEIPRYLLAHLLAGCIAGVVAAVGIVATNLGALRDLMLHSEGGWLAFGLLLFGCVLTFGSVAVGHGIMTIGDGED
jgi:type IV secretory pathway VirB2 component (pilin)